MMKRILGVKGKSWFLQKRFDFLDWSGEGAQELAAGGGDDDVVLQSYSSDLHVLFDLGWVEVRQFLGVWESFFYHEIDEVDSGLDCYANAFLESSSGSEFAQACKLASRLSFSISSYIVNLQSEEMSQAMREKDSSDSFLKKFFDGELVDNA